jgi:2-polyprenyl-6-methoxyphenol hydroxylase-like FAD-dependent oxidoreductase
MQSQEPPVDSRVTSCCIVGGGPAGAVLAYMLARAGVDTTLLEEHEDFDRDFRGDTIHPSVLQILDELGLVDRALSASADENPRRQDRVSHGGRFQ